MERKYWKKSGKFVENVGTMIRGGDIFTGSTVCYVLQINWGINISASVSI